MVSPNRRNCCNKALKLVKPYPEDLKPSHSGHLDCALDSLDEILPLERKDGSNCGECQPMNYWEWFFDHSIDMFAIASKDGYFKRVNPAFTETLGYSQEDLLSRPFVDFVHPDDKAITLKELQNLHEGIDSVRFENRYWHKNGGWRWLEWTCPAKPPNGDYFYAIARDITQNKLTAAEILFRAQHDPLTQLANRAYFDECLAKALLRAERNELGLLALYLIDINQFRQINASYGHSIGDRVLKSLAQRLKAQQRKGDLISRLGGDEFAVIVEGIASFACELIAERLVETICQPMRVDGLVIVLEASVGFSTYPEPAHDANSLFEQADAALYTVKATGKSGYRRFPKEKRRGGEGLFF